MSIGLHRQRFVYSSVTAQSKPEDNQGAGKNLHCLYCFLDIKNFIYRRPVDYDETQKLFLCEDTFCHLNCIKAHIIREMPGHLVGKALQLLTMYARSFGVVRPFLATPDKRLFSTFWKDEHGKPHPHAIDPDAWFAENSMVFLHGPPFVMTNRLVEFEVPVEILSSSTTPDEKKAEVEATPETSAAKPRKKRKTDSSATLAKTSRDDNHDADGAGAKDRFLARSKFVK